MPKVGDKKFPYTKEGIAAAEATAEVTGEEVIPTYDAGDRVKQYHEGGPTSGMESYWNRIRNETSAWGQTGNEGQSPETLPDIEEEGISGIDDDKSMDEMSVEDYSVGPLKYKKGGKVKKRKGKSK